MNKILFMVFLFSIVYAQSTNEYAKTIEDYFQYIKIKEYKKAYDLLSPITVRFSVGKDSMEMNGRKFFRGGIHHARMDYDSWLKMVKNYKLVFQESLWFADIKWQINTEQEEGCNDSRM
jgi:hypothetical protein